MSDGTRRITARGGRVPARRVRPTAWRVLLGALLLAATLLLAGTLGGAVIGSAAAADPTATPGEGGDPRSSGEGPGFVGEPLLAIGGVAVVGIGSVIATLAYVRLTDRRRP